MSTSCQRLSLHITRVNGKYSFTVHNHNQFPLAYEVFLPAPEPAIEQVRTKYETLLRSAVARMRDIDTQSSSSQKPALNELNLAREIGETISALLFPREVVKVIKDLNPESILLTTNDPNIPWELTRLDSSFLFERIALGKCLKTGSPLGRSPGFIPKNRLSLLLISNPRGDLPGADEEHDALLELLGRDPHFSVTSLSRSEAALDATAAVLRNNVFDIVHYAGHSSFLGMPGPIAPKLQLTDCDVSAQTFVNMFGSHPPAVLFLNSCSSAAITSPGVVHNYLEGIAPAFLHAGTVAVIGALWPVVDDQAIEIAKRFYAALANGKTLGDSLRLAKAVEGLPGGDRSASWVGYTLVGDPGLNLIDDSNWRSLRVKSDGSALARDLFASDSRLAIGGVHPFLIAHQTHKICLLAISAACNSCEALVVRPSLGHTNLVHLRKRRIGVTPLTSMHVYLNHLADDYQEDLRDYNLVFLDQGEIVDALLHGAIDAAVLWEPWLSMLEADGYSKVASMTSGPDSTLCGVAVTVEDLHHHEEEVLAGLKRYYYCVDLIKKDGINYAQLLALQLDVPLETIRKGLGAFEFIGSDVDSSAQKNRFWGYLRAENAYLVDRGLTDGLVEVERVCRFDFVDRCSKIDDRNRAPIPVAVQASISCAPFIVGRFLGLMR